LAAKLAEAAAAAAGVPQGAHGHGDRDQGSGGNGSSGGGGVGGGGGDGGGVAGKPTNAAPFHNELTGDLGFPETHLARELERLKWQQQDDEAEADAAAAAAATAAGDDDYAPRRRMSDDEAAAAAQAETAAAADSMNKKLRAFARQERASAPVDWFDWKLNQQADPTTLHAANGRAGPTELTDRMKVSMFLRFYRQLSA
jgi:hypothetical protein